MTTFGGCRRDTETATTERRSKATSGVRLVERPAGNWWCRLVSMPMMRRAPLGLCDKLINALKLLANQQKDGDRPIQSIVTGLHERNRRGVMDGLRFIQVDNHSVVDVVICVEAPDRFLSKNCSSARLSQRRP